MSQTLRFTADSPERANPGDRQHRLSTITKVTAGSTPQAAAFIDGLYRAIVPAGTHLASSIKVAEAAKVIENTQRDLNIALISEFAMIFNKLGIDTQGNRVKEQTPNPVQEITRRWRGSDSHSEHAISLTQPQVK